ncbi:hypothetical protein BBO99_00001432 [Phytophthora kernoviae]|uniref:Aldehyde dehydrogenase domain-containing protein n=1 Tax=Phytophthora kernoviae TaxID=325452 RepID=A0A421GZN3_9STRA|nr:hypothetical protein JM18_001699 [Phytophthora kernoviae]RLN26128.1 hypothetical protein BBI17_001301 [Phytophthora kernoviae]RLN84350.1 hypothetical protein BBO99_00001432 [Phytophthora kernoviae]
MTRLSRISGASLDVQEPKADAPHRHAKALQLWALGIGAVISGQYYGWQSSLVAGFDGMLIVLSMMTVLYTMLSFSLAELSATIPAGGGPYIFALHSIGPRAAFFSGLAETLKVIAVNSSTFYTIYSYLQTLFNVDAKFAPVFFIVFGIIFGGLNIYGVQASFRMQACSTTLCVLLLLIMFFSAIPHLDYNQWVVQQDWEYTDLSSAIEAIPYAMWFYLGIEELPLASDETIEPEKNIPRGLLMCIVTLIILSFGTAVFSSMIAPGAAAMADVSAPLVTSFQTIFGAGATTTFFKWMTVIALCSSPNSYVFFMGQLLFAIARDGYYPKFLAYEHPTRGTAAGALLFGTASCVLVAVILHYAIGDDDLGSVLINLTLLGALISYIFQLLSFVFLRIRQPNRPRPYRSPFGLLGAYVGLLLCGVSIFAIIYTSVTDTIFLASIVVTALVFIAGSIYFLKTIVPKIENKTLGSPVTIKEMNENLLSARSQAPHRYARAPQLWALGIGAVISGQYYGWQSSLIAGFDGMLVVLSIVTVFYVMLSFSIAELSATIPAGGGPYIFALHAIGPRAAFFSGLAETLKVIAVNASTFYTVYSYLQALFNVDEKFAPVFFIIFGVIFLSLNIFGVQASFRMQACSTTLCVGLLLFFFVVSIPYLDYDKWVVDQHWEFTNTDNVIRAIPFAMWFYLGIEELPLASDETIEPEKNLPRGLLLCIVTLVFLSFGTATCSSLISPGAAAMADVSAPLVTSFQTIFGNGAITTVLKWLTVIALTSSPNSYIFFMGQLLFAIAKDGYFPKFLAYEHPTRGTAVGALVFGTVMCEAIAILLHYTIGDANLGSALINLTLLGALISYIFQLLSYIYLAVRQPGRSRPYRSPFGVPGAVLGIALCGVAIFAILYSSLNDTMFLASIMVTVLVFMVGSVYYLKHVMPQIKNNTLCSPAAPKGDLFIDGKWVAPVKGKYIDVLNPANEEVIQQVAAASTADVDLAVQAAKRAFETWGATTGAERAVYLRKMAELVDKRIDAISRLETLDNGKPLAESVWDIEDVSGCFQYYAKAAEALDARQYEKVDLPLEDFLGALRYEPVGVVGAIIPWNYPALMALWKLAPALAAGCTVVLKPSEITPLSALQLAQIAADAGLPAGVLNVVNGLGAEAGGPLVEHPDVHKVAFTGSVPTGRNIMTTAAKDIKKISLELGGKSPAIVFDKVHMERTVEWVMFGCFWTNGQICSATSRLLVHEDFADEFIKLLVKETEKLVLGDPLDGKVQMGPLVSKVQQEKVLGYIKSAKDEGATVAGQAVLPTNNKGYFVPATVITNVKKTMRVWREEIFGPVLSVMTFKTEEEAIALANDSEFGLASAVFTSDNVQLKRVTKALRAGIVWNNCSQPCFVELPWGGVKKSGLGRELGPFGLNAYLEPKQICTYVADKPFAWYLKA